MDWQAFDLHLFDLDDTLITTRSAYTLAQEMAIRNAYPALPISRMQVLMPRLKWFCQTFGSGNVREYMAAFLKSESDFLPLIPSKLNEILHHYQSCFQSNLNCFDGVKPFLEYLTTKRKKLALVSNGATASQKTKLELTGLSSFFPKRHIFISDRFASDLKKPSPYMVENACKKTGVMPDKAVLYGNSVADILAGKLAGVATVHFAGSTALPEILPEIARPDFVISAWTELNCA